MTHVNCFEPVEDANAKILILGTMPGKESLPVGQYYAHPRNSFWPILGELVGAKPALPYKERIQVLRSVGIALWDVLESCVRPTSLDSDIQNATLVSNNFASFFSNHRKVTQVFFNGAKAEEYYRKYVFPFLEEESIVYKRLPSTSPANASMSYKRKLEAWRVVVGSRGDKRKEVKHPVSVGMSPLRFEIEERFEITGRGTAVVIDRVTALPVGKLLHATVIRPDGSRFSVDVFKEWLLRRDPRPLEKEAYVLRDVAKVEVPEGSSIEFDPI